MDRAGESTRTFTHHVKDYFNTLPLLSICVVITTWAVTICDLPGRLLSGEPTLSTFFNLDIFRIVHGYQGQRFLLYPLSSSGFISTFINMVFILPFLVAAERKHGSLRVAWVLFSLLTVASALSFVALLCLYQLVFSRTFFYVFSGTSAWTVGLAVWMAMEDEPPSDRMLFGVIRIPGRFIPHLIVLYYFLLMPDMSLILHLLAAGGSYLYASKKMPPRLVPSDDVYRNYEQRNWLARITNHPRFVAVDSTSGYLPIVTPTTTSAHLHHPPHFPAPSSSVNASSSGTFPGQGRRLGDE